MGISLNKCSFSLRKDGAGPGLWISNKLLGDDSDAIDPALNSEVYTVERLL